MNNSQKRMKRNFKYVKRHSPIHTNKIPVKTKGETVFHLVDWQRPKSLKICHDDKGVKSRNSLTLLVEMQVDTIE